MYYSSCSHQQLKSFWLRAPIYFIFHYHTMIIEFVCFQMNSISISHSNAHPLIDSLTHSLALSSGGCHVIEIIQYTRIWPFNMNRNFHMRHLFSWQLTRESADVRYFESNSKWELLEAPAHRQTVFLSLDSRDDMSIFTEFNYEIIKVF